MGIRTRVLLWWGAWGEGKKFKEEERNGRMGAGVGEMQGHEPRSVGSR